jgi:hypothetical protein
MSDARADLASQIFLSGFPQLDDRGRRLFTEAVQSLQRHSYVIRGGALRMDPIYAFLEKNEDLVNAYLTLGGWRLHLDREKGTARIFHPESHGRVRFNKGETTLILVLRLLYHEQKRISSELPDPIVTVGAIREKLHALLPAASVKPFLSRRALGVWLRKLEDFRILSFETSPYLINDDTRLKLYPVLEHLIASLNSGDFENQLSALYSSSESITSETQDDAQDEAQEGAIQ